MSSEELLPGIRVRKGDITPRVLVCGDPARAEKIANMLENTVEIAKGREYWTYRGDYKGTTITVSSHGVGASGAMLSFISLIKGGAELIIRMGTCGGLKKEVKAGSLVIATAAAKEDGVSNIYVPVSFPAVADIDVTNALIKAAAENEMDVFKGIVVTQGAFYSGVMPTNTELLAESGAIALEMELSALYTAASIHRVKAGAILSVDGNALAVLDSAEDHDPDPEMLKNTVEKGIKIALDALVDVKL
ncbi:MAG: nucleoside phosphorylase [Acidaminobacteraceae bacterium]